MSDYQHSPCAIHPSARHETVPSRQFLQKNVEEKRKIIKTNGLCFYYLKRHFAKYYNFKITCKVCGKGHFHLLHWESGGTKEASAPQKESKDDMLAQSASEEKLTKPVIIASCAMKERVSDANCKASVFQMTHTAMDVPSTKCLVKKTSFYALLDTGADISICSRQPAET